MELHIRRSGLGDADAIRRVAFDTGFFGQTMSSILDDRSRFEPSLGCYLRPGASTAFVAEAGGMVEGYAISSLGDVRLCTALAVTGGLAAGMVKWPFLSRRDRRWVGSHLMTAIHAPFSEERRFRTPGGPRLHINVRPLLRGSGAGSRLMEHLLDDLRRRGCRGVHANSYQTERNVTEAFWLKHGFAEFSRVRTEAWRRYVPEDVWLVCWTRRLEA